MSTSLDAGVDLGEDGAVLGRAVHAEVLNGAALHVGVRAALGGGGQHLAGARRVALREHEQRARLELRRRGALQDLLEHRHGLFGIRMLQALDREQLQLFIRFGFGTRRLAGVLAHLQFERLRVADPAALREALDQILHRGERVGLLVQLVERVGLPVERGVDAGRVLRVDDARERIRGARPGAALEDSWPR